MEAGVKIKHALEKYMFEHAKNLYGEDYFGFQQRLACIVTTAQPIALFCMGIHVEQTRSHRTHDLGQIDHMKRKFS
jgi:hypothetical protein